MIKYLLTTTETYRVENENDATALIEAAKKSTKYSLTKYNCVHKEKKEDEWWTVTLVKLFNLEKEPENSFIDVSYGNFSDSEEEMF